MGDPVLERLLDLLHNEYRHRCDSRVVYKCLNSLLPISSLGGRVGHTLHRYGWSLNPVTVYKKVGRTTTKTEESRTVQFTGEVGREKTKKYNIRKELIDKESRWYDTLRFRVVGGPNVTLARTASRVPSTCY